MSLFKTVSFNCTTAAYSILWACVLVAGPLFCRQTAGFALESNFKI